MKKNDIKTVKEKLDIRKLRPFSSASAGRFSFSPLPWTWLIGSLVFLFISTIVGRYFWAQLDHAEQATAFTPLSLFIGIGGIIVYLVEPIIWHNNIYGKLPPDKEVTSSTVAVTEQSLWSLIAELIISLVLGLIVVLPFVAIFMFKPVFRAILLYVSLSFLNIGAGNVAVHPFFILPVVADILLYYLGAMLPDWKFNPVNALINAISLKDRHKARFVGSILLVVHTALIYTLLQNAAHYDFSHHPENLNFKNLAWWWLFLTVYSHFSFIAQAFEMEDLWANLSRRDIWLTVLSLVISFVGFVWPFYFG